MKKQHYIALAICAAILGCFCLFFQHQINQKIDEYAISSTEKLMGKKHLRAEQEAFINALAKEMGITTPFLIRKTNQMMLAGFGYYNAFVYHPKVLNCIPISNKTFLYVSEGFFEDLSLEEQRFLIGHELIHIKEEHTKYYVLIVLAIFFMLLFIWRKYLHIYLYQILQRWISSDYHRRGMFATSIVMIILCVALSDGLGAIIRKNEERQADHDSILLLQSHDGGIAFMDRLCKEFGMHLHNPYGGLFSDHPSVFERKEFFLAHKSLTQDTL